MNLRLLPLLASATEILHALGLGALQVGRSHECDYPAEVLSLPTCTRPAIEVSGSSAEIDRLVKERFVSALNVYDVDAALIRQLKPTHILTQTQCEVCAVSLADVERVMQHEIGIDARIISLEPNALEDVWRDICRVAAACHVAARGEALVSSLQERMCAISAQTCGAGRTPRLAVIEWLQPLMAGGNWVPQLVEMAGGINLFGMPGGHSPWLSWDDLVSADPDAIVALPCGFDLARTRAEMHWLTERAGWCELRAVRTGNVFLCDGNQFMNRPGPRLVESLQIFAEMLHPALFEPKLEHVGWERLRPASIHSARIW